MNQEMMNQEDMSALLSDGGRPSRRLLASEREVLSSYSNVVRDVLSLVFGRFSGLEVGTTWKGAERIPREEAVKRARGEYVSFSTSMEDGLRGHLLVCFSKTAALQAAVGLGVEGNALDEPQMEALQETISLALNQVHGRIGRLFGVSISGSPVQADVSPLDDRLLNHRLGNDPEMVVTGFEMLGLSERPTKIALYASPDFLVSLEECRNPENGDSSPQGANTRTQAVVRPAQFEPLQPGKAQPQNRNLDLLLDVGLNVRVELGRTSMKIQDILDLGSGSVIELDKLAGEPVDLLVNDKLFARGEVVVIDENFGVRVTDILSTQERVQVLH